MHAVPGEGLEVPIWLLGSSDFSATLAAELGLPFAFASHFAPDFLLPAIGMYRANFKPSDRLAEPRVMVGVNVIAADTDAEAHRLFTSQQQAVLNMVRGRPGQLPPPVDSMDGLWNPLEQSHVEQRTRVSAVGSIDTVRERLTKILVATEADELILTAHIFDHAARLRSYELTVRVMRNAIERVGSGWRMTVIGYSNPSISNDVKMDCGHRGGAQAIRRAAASAQTASGCSVAQSTIFACEAVVLRDGRHPTLDKEVVRTPTS